MTTLELDVPATELVLPPDSQIQEGLQPVEQLDDEVVVPITPPERLVAYIYTDRNEAYARLWREIHPTRNQNMIVLAVVLGAPEAELIVDAYRRNDEAWLAVWREAFDESDPIRRKMIMDRLPEPQSGNRRAGLPIPDNNHSTRPKIRYDIYLDPHSINQGRVLKYYDALPKRSEYRQIYLRLALVLGERSELVQRSKEALA